MHNTVHTWSPMLADLWRWREDGIVLWAYDLTREREIYIDFMKKGGCTREEERRRWCLLLWRGNCKDGGMDLDLVCFVFLSGEIEMQDKHVNLRVALLCSQGAKHEQQLLGCGSCYFVLLPWIDKGQGTSSRDLARFRERKSSVALAKETSWQGWRLGQEWVGRDREQHTNYPVRSSGALWTTWLTWTAKLDMYFDELMYILTLVFDLQRLRSIDRMRTLLMHYSCFFLTKMVASNYSKCISYRNCNFSLCSVT